MRLAAQNNSNCTAESYLHLAPSRVSREATVAGVASRGLLESALVSTPANRNRVQKDLILPIKVIRLLLPSRPNEVVPGPKSKSEAPQDLA